MTIYVVSCTSGKYLISETNVILEFLKIDFPQVFTNVDYDSFIKNKLYVENNIKSHVFLFNNIIDDVVEKTYNHNSKIEDPDYISKEDFKKSVYSKIGINDLDTLSKQKNPNYHIFNKFIDTSCKNIADSFDKQNDFIRNNIITTFTERVNSMIFYNKKFRQILNKERTKALESLSMITDQVKKKQFIDDYENTLKKRITKHFNSLSHKSHDDVLKNYSKNIKGKSITSVLSKLEISNSSIQNYSTNQDITKLC